VIVVEAAIESGTMETVRFAREQGKPVAVCVYDNMEHRKEYEGNRKLIKESTNIKINGADDIKGLIEGYR